jgi:DNA repair protein RadC
VKNKNKYIIDSYHKGMDTATYERPREKLRQHGASSLTNTELLQLIIGSGNARTPVAKLARTISELLVAGANTLTYDELINVNGLGNATVCRILAALQLGERTSSLTNDASIFNIADLRKGRKRMVIYVTLDGSGRVLARYQDALKPVASTIIARRIYAKALADGANGVAVIIYSPGSSAELSVQELSLVSELKDLAARLQVRLQSVEYLTKSDRKSLRGSTP